MSFEWSSSISLNTIHSESTNNYFGNCIITFHSEILGIKNQWPMKEKQMALKMNQISRTVYYKEISMAKSTYHLILCTIFCLFGPILIAQDDTNQQNTDAKFIKDIHNQILTDGECYDWLTELTTNVGARLAGSPGSIKAVEFMELKMNSIGFDKVWTQECKVNYWDRGEEEKVYMTSPKSQRLNALSLGNMIGTDGKVLEAEIIEVKGLDEVEILGIDKVKGKIVFYNRPMDPTQIRTFSAYGGAVDQRVYGASKAAEYGAVAVLVRSMTTRQDDVPHTGTSVYDEEIKQIPAISISTNDANMLSDLLLKEQVIVSIQNNAQPMGERTSHSVIGEIKGSEFPNEIILVGGHLDSWDVGAGAHDDGAGCVHSLQVVRTMLKLGYKPKRTIRCVMFQNEENGLAGGREYARISNEKGEYHLAALESDSGGFVPRGFSFEGHADVLKPFYRHVSQWLPLLESYGLQFSTGGSGADIGPLKSQKGLLIGLRPDSQRYFDYHHTDIDRIDAVNQRELELGAAAMTSLIYLIDKYGLQ